jgi:hypothetical protein
MTRRVLTIVLSATLLGATTVPEFVSGSGDRMAAAPWVHAVESSATVVAGGSVSRGDPNDSSQQPAPFDRLWVGLVGVVGLLLVVRMVRLETVWRRQPGIRPKTWNESRSRDVLTDE